MKTNLSSAEDFLKKWKKQQNLSFTHLHHHTVFRIQKNKSFYSSFWFIVGYWIVIALT